MLPLNVFGSRVCCHGNCDEAKLRTLLSQIRNENIAICEIYEDMKSSFLQGNFGSVSLALIDPEDGDTVWIELGWFVEEHKPSDCKPELAIF